MLRFAFCVFLIVALASAAFGGESTTQTISKPSDDGADEGTDAPATPTVITNESLTGRSRPGAVLIADGRTLHLSRDGVATGDGSAVVTNADVASAPAPTGRPAATRPASPSVAVDAEDLMRAHRLNEISAAVAYGLDKRLLLRGIVTSVRIASGGPELTLWGNDPDGRIRCLFAREDLTRLSLVQTGDAVTLRGDLVGRVDYDVIVEDCRLDVIRPAADHLRRRDPDFWRELERFSALRYPGLWSDVKDRLRRGDAHVLAELKRILSDEPPRRAAKIVRRVLTPQ